jgi:tRNA-Thr(GGU) m(6)t(6)A37 methyltransferase TsaA
MTEPELSLTPIGVIRTPFADRASAPRQPDHGSGAAGVIELVPDGRYEHALEDLDRFRFIWVLFWFHLNDGWHAKVRPPRSAERRGLFATRSPYRPNPIGMSVLRLERIEGLSLHVLGVDMVDGTPLIDIKPYIPYSDSIPDAGHGWLDDEGSGAEIRRPVDPGPSFEVRFSPLATEQLEFLRDRFGIDLKARIASALSCGPTPHPYRRIRSDGDAFRLAVQEWRARFVIERAVVTVLAIFTGYRARGLRSDEPALDAHREYTARYGDGGDSGEDPSRCGA